MRVNLGRVRPLFSDRNLHFTFIADMFEHLFDADRPRTFNLKGHVKNKVCNFKEFMTIHWWFVKKVCSNYSRTENINKPFRAQCLQLHQLHFDPHWIRCLYFLWWMFASRTKFQQLVWIRVYKPNVICYIMKWNLSAAS